VGECPGAPASEDEGDRATGQAGHKRAEASIPHSGIFSEVGDGPAAARVGQLVDSAPIAPSFEDVTRRSFTSSPRRWMPHERGSKERIALVAAVVTVLVGAGVGYAVVSGGAGRAQAGGGASSIRLASYTAHLPSGYLVSTAPTPNCQTYPTSAVLLPMDSNSTYTVATPNATACIGSLLTASYGLDRSSPPITDPVPPSGAKRIRLGSYRAAVGYVGGFVRICENAHSGPPCTLWGAGKTASSESPLGIWVQIPSTGGGYHDLIVRSWGLCEDKLIALVQGALPKHVAAADAGHPPWSVIPACAPGQTPDPNASSANACVGNP